MVGPKEGGHRTVALPLNTPLNVLYCCLIVLPYCLTLSDCSVVVLFFSALNDDKFVCLKRLS